MANRSTDMTAEYGVSAHSDRALRCRAITSYYNSEYGCGEKLMSTHVNALHLDLDLGVEGGDNAVERT